MKINDENFVMYFSNREYMSFIPSQNLNFKHNL